MFLFRQKPPSVRTAWEVSGLPTTDAMTDIMRPQVPADCPEAFVSLMRRCWAEDAESRPDFREISRELDTIEPSRGSMVDNLIRMLEKYSRDLEGIVAERTKELAVEKEKVRLGDNMLAWHPAVTDIIFVFSSLLSLVRLFGISCSVLGWWICHQVENLVCRMLPRSIVEDLKVGKVVQAESFEQVTILFSGQLFKEAENYWSVRKWRQKVHLRIGPVQSLISENMLLTIANFFSRSLSLCFNLQRGLQCRHCGLHAHLRPEHAAAGG